MKIKQLLVLCGLVTLMSCGKSSLLSTKIANSNDSLSYAFGINIYNTLKQDSVFLNPEALAKAFLEAKTGKATMDDNTSKGYILTFMNKKEQAKYKNNMQAGESFLQKNRENPGVVVTESGLQYKVIKMGKGVKPVPTDVVKVNYTGTLIDGTKFDSSVDRGQPVQFPLNSVIKGWIEGLQLMPVGSKYMLYIPYNLAYGDKGASNLIKPYSTLIFEVELLDVVKK